MTEPQPEHQTVHFLNASYAQIRADADAATSGLRARIARLERDREALMLCLDVALASWDEAEAELEACADV